MFFIDTANFLHKMAKETLVNARSVYKDKLSRRFTFSSVKYDLFVTLFVFF